MTALNKELVAILREAGAIVHSDGNIFFTNAEKFLAAARASTPSALPVEGAEALVRDLLRQSEDNFNRQFGISVAAAWVYRDLEELLGSSDVCQGCKGAGGTQTGGPCAECYGQGTYEAAREFIRSQEVQHDKRCPAALNLSDACNCGAAT